MSQNSITRPDLPNNNLNVKHCILVVLGNFIEHFDAALYGFCAPLIAPLFFPTQSTISRLILSYGLFAVSLISRPLGAYYFSKQAEYNGLYRILSMTLSGIGLSTLLFGLAPTYTQIGIAAPIYLCICRLIQGFFAGGETSLAPLALIESQPRRSSLNMSFYGMSTIMGIMAASLSIQLIQYFPMLPSLWRWLFIGGGLLAIGCGALRINFPHTGQLKIKLQSKKLEWRIIIKIFLTTGLAYHFYSFPFIFIPNLMALTSPFNYTQLAAWGTGLMVMDAIVGMIIGYYLDCFDRLKCIKVCIASYIIFIPVIIYLLKTNHLGAYIIALSIIIIIGVIFNLTLIPYLRLDLGVSYSRLDFINAISAEALSKTTPVICLMLWHIYPTYFITFSFGFILCILSWTMLHYCTNISHKI